MNVDHGFIDIPYNNIPKLDDDLPNDYFYSNEYDYLTIHEVQLILILSDSRISYSFAGLKKRTSLHQHKLSKAIKRLQDRNFLSKNDNGSYELSDNGSIYTRKLLQDLINKNALNSVKTQNVFSVRKLYTKPPLEKEDIASILEKRWFSDYRFLYRRELADLTELCWEDSKSNQCHVYINTEGEIQIECTSLEHESCDNRLIDNWIVDEIQDNSGVIVEIDEDYNTKMVYN